MDRANRNSLTTIFAAFLSESLCSRSEAGLQDQSDRPKPVRNRIPDYEGAKDGDGEDQSDRHWMSPLVILQSSWRLQGRAVIAEVSTLAASGGRIPYLVGAAIHAFHRSHLPVKPDISTDSDHLSCKPGRARRGCIDQSSPRHKGCHPPTSRRQALRLQILRSFGPRSNWRSAGSRR